MRLREEINQRLRTDADFDAFCLDNFPEIHCRFSTGMDRVQKSNLLIQIADNDSILHSLRCYKVKKYNGVLKVRLLMLIVGMSILYLFSMIALDVRDLHRARDEYLETLELRARSTAAQLRSQDPAKADEFLKLHNENKAAILKNQFTLSHEITRSIHKSVNAGTGYLENQPQPTVQLTTEDILDKQKARTLVAIRVFILTLIAVFGIAQTVFMFRMIRKVFSMLKRKLQIKTIIVHMGAEILGSRLARLCIILLTIIVVIGGLLAWLVAGINTNNPISDPSALMNQPLDLLAAIPKIKCHGKEACLRQAQDEVALARRVRESGGRDLISIYRFARHLHCAYHALGGDAGDIPDLLKDYKQARRELLTMFSELHFRYELAKRDDKPIEQLNILKTIQPLCVQDRHSFCATLEKSYYMLSDKNRIE